MALSKTQALVHQFYDFEVRGRGWMIAPTAVDLEPPFHFFFGHHVPEPYVDDGKRHTWVSSFIHALKGKSEPTSYQYVAPEYEVYPFEDDTDLVAFNIIFARHHKVRLETLEHVYTLSVHCKYPLSFELVADETVRSYLICRATDRDFVYSQLKVFFSEASIIEDQTAIDTVTDYDRPMQLVDYGLKEEFMRPINLAQSLDHDPYVSLFGVFEQMQRGERAVLQILFSAAGNKWEKSILNSVTDGFKGSFFADAPEMPQLAQEKVSKPLFGVCVRVQTQADTQYDATQLLQKINDTFLFSTKSKFNSLAPLSVEGYDLETRLTDIRFRETHRLGMLLNSRELASIAHFPNPAIPSKRLLREVRNSKEAPASVIGHSFNLGTNVHQGKAVQVGLNDEQRSRHIHIVGSSGYGKSTLLLHLIQQDIDSNHGFAVVEPHSDLINAVLKSIPEDRIKDVVLIDPNDREFPIAFNILSAHSEVEREVLASDLVALFKRFSTSWGDVLHSTLANAIYAFLENKRIGTLPELRRFLVEKAFREEVLKTVTDPEILHYWRNQFPMLKGGSIVPILTRLDTFLRPKLIRNMVSQTRSLNFQELMDSGKIILVKLSEGLIGAENSNLLGSFIIAKIQQAAMARQAIESQHRTAFHLYIDECQHYVNPSMTLMLNGSRKYLLSLILSHQSLNQIASDTDFANAVMSNAGTRISFKVSDADAKRLSEGFVSFSADDLQNLRIGEAIAKVGRNEDDFNLVVPLPEHSANTDYTDDIIAYSRKTYGLRITPTEPPDEPTASNDDEPKPPPPTPSPKPLVVEVATLEPSTIRHNKKAPSQHRYQQNLIKKVAENNGYKASLEVQIPDGRVDVLLEKGTETIAVEVSVTTDATWEFHNIEKCLAQKYTHIFSCIDEAKMRQEVKRMVETLTPVPTNVLVDTMGNLLVFLGRSEQKPEAEQRTKGYKVNVQHRTITTDEANTKRAIIESIVKGSKKH